MSLRLSDQELRAKYRYWGRYYAIPECCIDQFTEDVLAGRSPVNERGRIDGEDNGWVPCDACLLVAA